MQFFRRAPGNPEKLGILSAAFNPPTRAHLALARAALPMVDEVLFVLPRVFPHDKKYRAVGLRERERMLEAALAGDPRFSIGSSEGGLFIDIARECRQAYGADVELMFICGRDAAERVVNWNYAGPAAFLEMLREFQLLVAPRNVAYEPPAEMRDRIHALPLPEDYREVSSTEVRERIARGAPWEQLVPESIVGLARRYYGPASGHCDSSGR